MVQVEVKFYFVLLFYAISIHLTEGETLAYLPDDYDKSFHPRDLLANLELFFYQLPNAWYDC